MIRVVCNSSPIIGLSKIGKLDLLWTLFDEVMIPEVAPRRSGGHYWSERTRHSHSGYR